MLAKRLDPVEEYRRRSGAHSPVYRARLKRRKLSIHARFVASAFDVFTGAKIEENIPAAEIKAEGEDN
ncbi:MAG TPA: hypothetical protein EYO33_15605 [Phycisphaerales bacterium]|nr:hypothetical protein [Phycisphaerales bacterium]